MTPDGLLLVLLAVALSAVALSLSRLAAVLQGLTPANSSASANSHGPDCAGLDFFMRRTAQHAGGSLESETGSGDPPIPEHDGPSEEDTLLVQRWKADAQTTLAPHLIQRWKADAALRERFEAAGNYFHHVDRMFIGLCRFEPALLPPDAMSRRQPEEK
jgi:hypothetical protein